MSVIKTMVLRREKEMKQFDEKEYLSEWRSSKKIAEDTVQVEAFDGTIWTVKRDLNFFTKPPQVFKSEQEVKPLDGCEIEWQPSLTSAKWLLMVMTNTI